AETYDTPATTIRIIREIRPPRVTRQTQNPTTSKDTTPSRARSGRHIRLKRKATTSSSRKTCSISPAPGCRQRAISDSSITPALPQPQATSLPLLYQQRRHSQL